MFWDLLKSPGTYANYKGVFDDVESFFSNIPVAQTLEYMLKHIYTNKE